jgi:hypothetical protein
VTEDAFADVLARTRAATSALHGRGRHVDLRGSILVPRDETVFCLFDGSEADVRVAAELAGIAFERVTESRWVPAR